MYNTCCVRYTNDNAIKKALNAAVKKGTLEKNKASFLIPGELYEDTSEQISIEEIKKGSGEAVARGDEIQISYKGLLQENKNQFDAGKKFNFVVGAGDVIKGMDAGVIGMREGGKRVVTIPASLGYGKRGSGPDIPPNSTLVFHITLKHIL